MNGNKLSLQPSHLAVPLGAFKMTSEAMVRLAQTVHISYTDSNTISKQKRSEISHDARHLGLPLGASNIISEPMVRTT
jgi:hypothetical protein